LKKRLWGIKAVFPMPFLFVEELTMTQAHWLFEYGAGDTVF